MSDRELLELAAKACGYRWSKTVAEERAALGKINLWLLPDDGSLGDTAWNPLTDDGDAFRLAVTLQLIVDTNGMHARVHFPYEAPLAYEPMTDDRSAATRRAIVRAAAEIGKATNQGAAHG